MTHGETGLIQFNLRWESAPAPQGNLVDELVLWRNHLRAIGLVGVTQDGIGYGNLSARLSGSTSFIISGTSTGGKSTAGSEDFTEVTSWDIAANAVTCRGPVRASAESLSHAAIYEAMPNVHAVAHVHHTGLWRRLYGNVATTDDAALAGTREIAIAILELLKSDAGAREHGMIVMGGHADGILSFDRSVEGAARRLLFELNVVVDPPSV